MLPGDKMNDHSPYAYLGLPIPRRLRKRYGKSETSDFDQTAVLNMSTW